MNRDNMRRNAYQAVCTALSGALVALCFPTVFFGRHLPEMGWLAWIALVPLVIVVLDASPRRAFALAFISGLVAYGGSLYWIYRALHHYGKLPPLASSLVLALMILILAAYIALAPAIARFIQTRWRGEMIALLPACWASVELARNYGPAGGFPWANIAMSQWRALSMIQIADLVGIYGLIFLIVWVNVCLAEIVSALAGRRPAQLALKTGVTIALLVATFAYGRVRLGEISTNLAPAGTMTVGIVQGNIAQEDKWREDRAIENLKILRRGTRALRDASVDLVLWPEASFPWPIDTRTAEIEPIALGFDAEELGPVPRLGMGAISEKPDGGYYNSFVLFDAKGNLTGRYHKVHLVPFGEYVPYGRLLFFARKLTEPAGNFSPGEGYEPILIGDTMAGPLVCYEDIFPEISRSLVRNGAEYLVNVTNDAWYGVSSAPFQHLALAVFRSVENRRYMVRATNTGVSAVISPSGRVETESGIFHDALIVAPIGLRRGLAPYSRMGDWFAYACAAYAAIGLIIAVAIGIRKRRGRSTAN